MGTDLDMILRNNNIQTLVVTGVVTWGCVLSTVKGGEVHDYFQVILEDCVAAQQPDLHEAALKIMRWRHDVLPSTDIIPLWKKR